MHHDSICRVCRHLDSRHKASSPIRTQSQQHVSQVFKDLLQTPGCKYDSVVESQSLQHTHGCFYEFGVRFPGCPCDKCPTVLGSDIEAPDFWKLPYRVCKQKRLEEKVSKFGTSQKVGAFSRSSALVNGNLWVCQALSRGRGRCKGSLRNAARTSVHFGSRCNTEV